MYERLGNYRPRGLGRCGLCGQQRAMTEAHVPPQAVGNNGNTRVRAQWVSTPAGARLGSWKPGGLSVFGLCFDCNNLTSGKADPAYVDFHKRMAWLLSHSTRRLLVSPADLPARLAPGLVARSVLAGMFAINDDLQDRFPGFAFGLRSDARDLRLPPDLKLCLALTDGPRSRIGGPVGYMRVLNQRTFHMPLADIWFPPLAWCLRSSRDVEADLGPEMTSTWSDVTEWIRYDPDLVTDLRFVTRGLPLFRPPEFGADEWVILTGQGVMTALEGRLKSGAG